MYTVSLLDYDSTFKGELSIYDPFTSDEEFMITEPKLSLAASQAGSFSCTIPVTNRGYGKIINHRTRAIVRKDDKIIFMGRISSSDKDLYLNQKIEAEGALAYLNDSITDKKIYSYETLFGIVTDIFSNHNLKFPNEPWKRFHLMSTGYGDDDIYKARFTGRDDKDSTSDKITSYSVNYDVTMDIITELLTAANAVLKTEYNELTGEWDVYIYDKYKLPLCSQPIEFGQNLVDLIQSYENDICSAVMPFGGELNGQSNEIGPIIAGDGVTPSIYNHALLRAPDNYDYDVYSVSEPKQDQGYWGFKFDIEAYNATLPEDQKLKRLYVSWRAHKFTEPSGYICDNAWRVLSHIGNDWQSLGYHEITSDGFESAINEVIDLTDSKYANATHIYIGGWGGAVRPTIRRDAIIVEEPDRVNIKKCEVIDPTQDTDGLQHEENSLYLVSTSLLNSYGRIEKKLEYDIEDTMRPVDTFVNPYVDADGKHLGSSAVYDNRALGYEVPYNPNAEAGHEYDYTKYKGLYNLIPFPAIPDPLAPAYRCIEYILPPLNSPNRPRGVFITSRMHQFGLYQYSGDGKYYQIDGIYCFLDESGQVLSAKAASAPDKGVGFTQLRSEYIDLNDAEYYGTYKIRVGGYVGGGFGLNIVPSDDANPRNRLMTQARFYLTQQQWEKVVIEATAVDLNMVDSDWENFDICRNAKVYSNPHSITATLPITSIEIQLDNYENNTVKLGYDSDEYLSTQLADNLRIMSIEQTLEEKRRNST